MWTVPNELTSTGRLRVELFDRDGTLGVATNGTAFGIQPRTTDTAAMAPRTFALMQNMPNPFNPTTVIGYDLPAATRVRLHVFDTEGNLVRILVDADEQPGHHQANWDGRDRRGNRVTSGVYFYRLSAARNQATKRLVMLK